MSPGKLQRKPRVVALGDPKYVGEDFLSKFKEDFDFDVNTDPWHSSILVAITEG